MATTAPVRFEVFELVRILREIEPAALLVPPRVLRRVIKYDRGIGGMGLSIPHRKSYIIGREPLQLLASPQELDIMPGEEIPATVMLLERPDPQRLAKLNVEQALVKYWRTLFHGRIDLEMAQRIADGRLDRQAVRLRIQQLGFTAFEEIAFVMRQENYLLPPETPESVYAEFISVYWTQRLFTPKLLLTFFPCLRNHKTIEALARSEIDGEALLAATRLPGDSDPEAVPRRITQPDGYRGQLVDWLTLEAPLPLGSKSVRRLQDKAQKSDARGNNVRAAIMRTRAANGANLTVEGAHTELSRIVQRLQVALELSDDDAEQWRRSLLPLMTRAANGTWSQEARFLYDLQKVCVDSERGVYSLDLIGWAITLGRRPLSRTLPGHQAVAIVRHLRSAQKRMRFVRLANGEREQLTSLLGQAIEDRVGLLRDRFRPAIVKAVRDAGLRPENVPEEVGRAKLIEELLDRVVDLGHLNMENLRDAISRNQLKLDNLTVRELVRGDQLVRLNRKLAIGLEGVYRKGEIYLRFFQRLSSVFFGTDFGRLLSRFVLLPIAASFVTLMLVMEAVQLLQPSVSGHPEKVHFPPPWQIGTLGVFFLLLFQVPPFRHGLWQIASTIGVVLRGIFVDVPAWLLSRPTLRSFLDSRPVRFFRRMLLRPMAYGGAAAVVTYLLDPVPDAPTMVVSATAIFSVTILLAFTRVGRMLEETTTDWLVLVWQRGLVELALATIAFFADLFKTLLEWFEQGMYTVDEWLRFRGGQSWLTLAFKAPLVLVWSCVTYVARFSIILLIEPQINPIKHFPVVTVSHKVMLALTPAIADAVSKWLQIGYRRALAFVGSVIWLIPGIFGFAVWELKENWKLYAANRPKDLKPVLIGSHGETMLRLLRPGFHSGTIPKLFHKLRKAVLHGKKATERKAAFALHHVQESIGDFIERELLALFRLSKGWNGLAIEVASVHLATNRIAVELACPDLSAKPLIIGLDHKSGWLLAGVLDAGWLPALTPKQRETFTAAIAGLYKMAGVSLTREQLAKTVAPPPGTFVIRNHDLIYWPNQDKPEEITHDLTIPVEGWSLLYADIPLSWQDWVETWELDRSQDSGTPLKLAYAVLP